MEDEGKDDYLADGIVRVRDEDCCNERNINRDGAKDGRNKEWPGSFSSLDVEEEGHAEEDPDSTDDGGSGFDVFTSEGLRDGDAVIGVSASEVSKKDAQTRPSVRASA